VTILKCATLHTVYCYNNKHRKKRVVHVHAMQAYGENRNIEWPKKMYTLLQLFGGFDSVWMPMVATLNNYTESKIQGHLSYQFCFCIDSVVTIIE